MALESNQLALQSDGKTGESDRSNGHWRAVLSDPSAWQGAYGGKSLARKQWRTCRQPEEYFSGFWEFFCFWFTVSKYRAFAQSELVGARARELYDRMAKERQKEAQARGRQKQKGIPVNLPESMPDNCDARDQAGRAVGVSGKAIDQASKVLKQGAPELIAAVEKDLLAVSTAARIASRPDGGRTAAIAWPTLPANYRK